MDIIDRINALLALKGKTGADMSRDLGLSNSIYSQWNTRKTRPSNKTLEKLANYFDVSVEYLMGFGELDLVLPPNMQGANLSGAKIDSQFLSYILSRLSQVDPQNPRYESTKNAVLSLAESSGLEKMAKQYIEELELGTEQKEKPAPASESELSDPLYAKLIDLLQQATPEQKKAMIALLESMQPGE